ncbi:hypothetical protein GGF32_002754 [Allomyces javanicus]|nr:hypothetical protein GGF32_002754 [Allomyces javanicus]
MLIRNRIVQATARAPCSRATLAQSTAFRTSATHVAPLHAPARAYHVTYFGSDHFSVRVLDNLLRMRSEWIPNEVDTIGDKKSGRVTPQGHHILKPPFDEIAVVTPPCFPAGRQLHLSENALSQYARVHNLKVFHAPARSLKRWEMPWNLAEKTDLAVVVSCPYFIPPHILDMFPSGAMNLHPSLLPKYRGAAPIQHAIWNNDQETGISIIDLDPNRFDAGAILAQQTVAIPDPNTIRFPELANFLADQGSALLLDVICNFKQAAENAKIQDEKQVTRARKITKEDGIIFWDEFSATEVWNRWRAIGHQVPMRTVFGVKRVELHLSGLRAPETPATVLPPGRFELVLEPEPQLRVHCADGQTIGVTRVKPVSRKEQGARDFVNGRGGPGLMKTKPFFG